MGGKVWTQMKTWLHSQHVNTNDSKLQNVVSIQVGGVFVLFFLDKLTGKFLKLVSCQAIIDAYCGKATGPLLPQIFS